MGNDCPPTCSCDHGPMLIVRVTRKDKNHGRFFYRCSVWKDHGDHFIWCDEYHKDDDIKPSFLVNNVFPPNASTTASCSTRQFVSNSSPVFPTKTETTTSVNESIPPPVIQADMKFPDSKPSCISIVSLSDGGYEIKLDQAGSWMLFCCIGAIILIISLFVLILGLMIGRLT